MLSDYLNVLIFTYLSLSQKSPFCGINKSMIEKIIIIIIIRGNGEKELRGGEVTGRERWGGGAFIKGTEITVQSFVFNRVTNN